MKTKEFFPQMHLACSNDDLRPVMSYVYITKDHSVATNAHIIAIAETKNLFDDDFINIIPDDGFYIHKDDWKKICQCDCVLVESEKVVELVHNRKRNELIKIELVENVGKFPNWKAVIPRPDKEKIPFNTFGLNGEFLATVQKIISKNDSLVIETFTKNSGFLVKSWNSDAKTMGLIMPCKIEEDQKIEIPNI